MDRVSARTVLVGSWIAAVGSNDCEQEFCLESVGRIGPDVDLRGRTVDGDEVSVCCAPTAWVLCTLPAVQS